MVGVAAAAALAAPGAVRPATSGGAFLGTTSSAVVPERPSVSAVVSARRLAPRGAGGMMHKRMAATTTTAALGGRTEVTGSGTSGGGGGGKGDGTGPRRVRRSLVGPAGARRRGSSSSPDPTNGGGSSSLSSTASTGGGGRHQHRQQHQAVMGPGPPPGSGGPSASNADGINLLGVKRGVSETTTRAGTEIYTAELDTAVDDSTTTHQAIEETRASLKEARKSLHVTLSGAGKTMKSTQQIHAAAASSTTTTTTTTKKINNINNKKAFMTRNKDRVQDHYASTHQDGVRQGWPLSKLLENLPEIPSAEDINLTSCRAHLKLYDTLVDSGRLHNALELARALKAAGLETVGGKISHKAFLRQAAKRNAVAVAFEFVAFVNYPDVRLYNMLLSVCAAACDSRSGFAALVLMYDAGVTPDCRAYTTLISACAKSGELDKARGTLASVYRLQDRTNPSRSLAPRQHNS